MAKKFLLIAESDDETRSNLAEELSETTQMIVIQASNGVQAYQKTRNQKFDVILTEWNMPKLGGHSMISSIRETDHNEKTPIIIYTDQSAESKEKTREFDILEILPKPQEIEKLTKKIKELLEFDPNKKRFRVDVDFINPFIDVSLATLTKLGGIEGIKALRPYLMPKEEELEIDISGKLAISSPYFSGSFAVSFPENIFKDIIGKMIEEKVEKVDAENQDGAAEIVNIIYGNTKAVLNQKGYKLQRAVPSVVRGKNHKIYQDTKTPVLLVPFNSDAGRFYIQICVKAI